ncbi:MAG: hypothetical protein K2G44_02080 [Clostridia bacterium]|nr:hypothetical protein [Clostridia bacterium]
MDYTEILKKFVSGEITIEEFREIYFNNVEIQQFLQDNLPDKMLKTYGGLKLSNGDFNEVLKAYHWGTKFGNYGVQCCIKRWLSDNSIDCVVTPTYQDDFEFLLDIMPDYINGVEAERLIESICQSAPQNLGKTKYRRLIKEKIKEAFHIQDGKYPKWVQHTDWPFSPIGKPLKYLSTKKDGDLIQYTFVDIDTGNITIVEEFD